MDEKVNSTVGVLVGRFQVAELTHAHKILLQKVAGGHSKVIVFLGVNPLKSTKPNPLDFEARKQMLMEENKQLIILPLLDVYSDDLWSQTLDQQIEMVLGITTDAVLYGSRDSFIPYYTGKYTTATLNIEKAAPNLDLSKESGTDERFKTGHAVINNKDFRAGVIWGSQNRYVNATPCVDVAIIRYLGEKEIDILLGKKKNEPAFRFIGGHVDVGESFEDAAYREVLEETNISISDLEYIGSAIINDYRHNKNDSGITTVFYMGIRGILGEKGFKNGFASDDIFEIDWFGLSILKKSYKTLVMPEHQKLAKLLINHLDKGEN